MSAEFTQNRILDVAERLFAENGISGTSLRAITREAEANLAAVHYHFGSKEGLLDAVIARRARPVNQARMTMLRQLKGASGDRPLEVEEVLLAYLAPTVGEAQEMIGATSTSDEPEMSRLLVRIEAEPPDVVETLFRKNFGAINATFLSCLEAALPHLSKETVVERFRFVWGTVGFIFSGNFDLDIIRDHSSRTVDLDERIQHVIHFLGAGMRAPEAGKDKPEQGRASLHLVKDPGS
jgi:AcrR family transcriptional regulator